MMRMRQLTVAASLAAFALQGCTIRDIQREQAATTEAARTNTATSPQSRPVVQFHDSAWLMGERIAASKPQPAIYDKLVDYSYPAGSLVDVSQWIMRATGIPVVIDQSVDASLQSGFQPPKSGAVGGALPPLPPPYSGSTASMPGLAPATDLPAGVTRLTYKGPFKGFLDQQQNRFGVWSRYRDGTITFFRTETRMFPLPALSETSVLDSTITTASTSSGGSGSGGGSSSGGSSGDSGNSQTSTLKVEISPWKRLETTVGAVAAGAKVVADPDLGMLVVTGTPPQCDAVESMMKSLNAMYGKKIAVDIHVYSVELQRGENYGLDLSLQYKSATGHTSAGIAGAPAPAISGGGKGLSFGANILSGPFAGTNGAVRMLSSLGNVTTTLSNAGVTQNGKKITLQDGERQGYLAQQQSTLAANVGSTATSQADFVTTGFTGQFLPKLVNGAIVMDMALTINRLLAMETLPPGCSPDKSQNCLVTPHTKNYDLQSIATLQPGESLVLVGMQRDVNSTQNNGVGSPFMPLLGGGVDGSQSRTLLAVVISARLL